MLQCLRGLNQYQLLEHSYQREFRFVNDQDLVERPYIDLIKVIFLLSFLKAFFRVELSACGIHRNGKKSHSKTLLTNNKKPMQGGVNDADATVYSPEWVQLRFLNHKTVFLCENSTF